MTYDGRGDVRDLGRSRRLVSERQFRALLLRDGHCRHPGCTSRAGLQAHHVVHWIDGGRTDLANLILLCGRHHRAHHDGAFEILLDGQRCRFVRSDGRELMTHIDPAELLDTDRPVEHEHRAVAADAATTRWRGERMDHDWAISVFAQRRYDERTEAS